LDVLCGAIDVSCVGDEQTKTDSGVDQSRMNIVTEVEQSEPSPTDDLGAETIATNSCKQSATDHFTEVEGDDADKTGSVVALLRCGVLNGDSPLYGLDIDNVNFPFPDEMPKIRFPVIPSTFSGGDLELEGVPPPVIIESSEFLGHLTAVDHRMFAVEFERLDIIDMFFLKFSQLPDKHFETISGTKIRQFSVGHDYSLLFEKDQLNAFLDTFKAKGKGNSHLHKLDHLDLNEVYVTAFWNHGTMVKPQRPHIDYSWEVLLMDSR
jgi:hypothetical protein